MGTDGRMNDASRRNKDLDTQTLLAVGEAVLWLDAALQNTRSLSIEVVGLNVRRPRHDGDEVFLVVKGLDAEGTPCVAFHSAFTLGEALRGLEARLRNGTLKWKVDQFARGA